MTSAELKRHAKKLLEVMQEADTMQADFASYLDSHLRRPDASAVGMAFDTGLSASYLSDIRNRKRAPSQSFLRKLIEVTK